MAPPLVKLWCITSSPQTFLSVVWWGSCCGCILVFQHDIILKITCGLCYCFLSPRTLILAADFLNLYVRLRSSKKNLSMAITNFSIMMYKDTWYKTSVKSLEEACKYQDLERIIVPDDFRSNIEFGRMCRDLGHCALQI